VGIASCRPQGPARVRPSVGLRERLVEVLDERLDSLAEFVERREAAALEEATGEDAEPDLDLVQPRAVLRGVDEPDAMRRIGQECLARRHGLEDARLSLLAEVALDAAPAGNPLDERRGHV